MKFGVLGAADIAKRRFLPALAKCKNAEFSVLAVSSEKRLEAGISLAEEFGGKAIAGYDKLLENEEIEAVYIPLPPSLHYEWAKKALLAGKHVFVEKPSTIDVENTEELVDIAKEKNLAIVENYGFVHHPQIALIKRLISDGEIGDIRNVRTAFGFPKRQLEDIRHQKDLGGGGLLDAGGYTIRAGFELLGESSEVVTASLNYIDGFEVDMYGTLTMENAIGHTLQASFGMDNFYKCELEIWGQKGMIKAPRFYTAPDGSKPQVILTTNDGETVYEADSADQFLLQTEYFMSCIKNEDMRNTAYDELIRQIEMIAYAFDLAE